MRASRLIAISVLAGLFLVVQGRSAANTDPPSDDAIRAKRESRDRWLVEHPGESFSDAYDAFLERTLADIDVEELTGRQLALLVPLIWDLDAHARPAVERLRALAEDEGADGAIAAVALFQLNYMYRVLELEVILAQALTHPSLGKAFKEGEAGSILSHMKVLPEETLRELNAEVLGVAPLLEQTLPAEFVPYAVDYFSAVAKMGDAVAHDLRERIRNRVVDLCDGAIRDVEAGDPDQANQLRQMRAYVIGRAAIGALLDRPAPDLEFTWFSGGESPRSLGDLRGSVVVLDFWTTWCPACIEGFPDLRALQEHYQDSDVRIISITWLQGKHYERGRPPIDTSNDADLEYRLMAEFMEKKDMTWPVAFADGEAVQDYGLMMTGIPHLTIIDREGVVRYDGADADVPVWKQIENIDGLLAATAPPGKAADREHPEAMYQIGKHHAERRRFGIAAESFRKAALAGHAGAMVQLGVLHAEGHGVTKDPALAVQWYQRAVDAGSTDGMNHLGVAYVGGEGVERDPHRAFKLFEQAAEKGDAVGMYNLGITYGRGRGVAADHEVAIEWLRKAAAAGSDAARDRLIKEGVEPPASPASEPE